MKHRFTINYRDDSTTLNSKLVLKQNLNVNDIQAILSLHWLRMAILDVMRKIFPTSEENVKRLRHFANRLRQLEFEAQKQWRFEQDVDKHSWWWTVPHCTCPSTANLNAWFTRVFDPSLEFARREKIVDTNCIIHG